MMYAIAAVAGILMGIIYFGGLWLTIQRMSQVNRPILILSGSFIIRLGMVLVGFYLVSDGRLEFLAVSLVTFFMTRFYFISKIQPVSERSVESHGNQS
jgi:F1F0 ATPase subunit 2